MVKVFTDSNYLTQEHRRRIFPLLFDLCFIKSPLIIQKFILTESISEADVAILPVDLGHYYSKKKKNEVDNFITNAQNHNIPIWIYSGGDFGINLSKPNVTVFRLGGFHSKMPVDMQILPSFVSDTYENNDFRPLSKKETPTVGFVGNADGTLAKWCKEYLIYLRQSIFRLVSVDNSDNQFFYPSSVKRFKYLKRLERTKGVTTDFIYRNKYRAGAKDMKDREQTTKEFFENVERNMYTFCLRGSGNFSVRFYETLIMGRIPLLIDTDVRLPLNDEIDWNRHCVIANPENFEEKLLSFHNSHSEEELMKIQKKNRELALNFLSRENYFIKITDKLLNH